MIGTRTRLTHSNWVGVAPENHKNLNNTNAAVTEGACSSSPKATELPIRWGTDRTCLVVAHLAADDKRKKRICRSIFQKLRSFF